ncbi:hypothetical protein GGTG_13015 [Gaeumannomyces tritici R3-111a-1]|uniref:Heterokaryon incompatibility domain-containing protein n=1 Tax=Gaeumannomyces tritici (strain R3-111a-1) TaxID=644352 RepID=J3PHN5_GAET3|nr:hypothetical protein GGTG_13015 [Gaeumannomyces tritici R3-111a-1]EJT69396.1 hypothetical protein GGTG_13015 [Gaeumannomyces tritici R3-111a-1]
MAIPLQHPTTAPSFPKIAAAQGSAFDQYRTKTGVLYHEIHSASVFRVLEIDPGSFESPVICKFHHIDLDALHLQDDALSYAWEDPSWRYSPSNTEMFAVLCDGHELKISPNLHEAIRHVRSARRRIFLWADAVCINQEDTAERGHQVSLMASIYRRARQTIVWLGDNTRYSHPFQVTERQIPEAQLAFGAICDIVNNWGSLKAAEAQGGFETASYRVANPVDEQDTREFRHCEDQGLSSPKPEPSDSGIDADAVSAKTSPLWKSIAGLFSQPWFWRVRVVQEVVLAQSAVVRWGHAEIDWRWIGLASAIRRTNYSSICEAMVMGGVYNAYLMFRLSPMSDLPPITLSFIQLLRLTRQLAVTDARDRLYGLLGIRTTDSDPEAGLLFLRPDYSVSERELWKRVAIKAIGESHNLSLLSSVQHDTFDLEALRSASESHSTFQEERSPEHQPLPSWVPNWSVACCATLAPWDRDDRFAAAKDFPLHLGSPIGSNNLLVEGIQIGMAVKRYGTGWRQAVTALLGGRDAYGSLQAADSDDCLADLAAYILDCAERERQETKSYGGIFERHPRLEEKLESLAEGGNTSRFCSTVDSVSARRQLFTTMNGYFGLGPDLLEKGDVVCVLSGADLPLVLSPTSWRRQQDENDGEGAGRQPRPTEPWRVDHNLLVGECYVEGLMNGETMAGFANGDDPVELFGPLPPQLLEDDILSAASEPERNRARKARLEQLRARNLFTPASLKAARRTRAEKRWFNIR